MTRAGGEVLVAGVLLTTLVALWPLLAAVCLVMAPLALAGSGGRRHERRLAGHILGGVTPQRRGGSARRERAMSSPRPVERAAMADGPDAADDQMVGTVGLRGILLAMRAGARSGERACCTPLRVDGHRNRGSMLVGPNGAGKS